MIQFNHYEEEILIWSDGASRGNPGQGGWVVIIVSPEKEVIELGGGEKYTTNSKMELMGAISARDHISKNNFTTAEKILIHTDSKYVISGIWKWVHGWRRNNWQTSQKEEVLNRDFLGKIIFSHRGKRIEWNISRTQRNAGETEDAIKLPRFADGSNPPLYKGALSSIPFRFLICQKFHPQTKTKSRSKAKAYSYLSMIDGAIMKHKTWEECEKRVKGKSGAKFKRR